MHQNVKFTWGEDAKAGAVGVSSSSFMHFYNVLLSIV